MVKIKELILFRLKRADEFTDQESTENLSVETFILTSCVIIFDFE